jgi:hypothetical protein
MRFDVTVFYYLKCVNSCFHCRCILSGVMGDIDLRTQLEMLLMRGFLHFDLQHFLQKIFLPIVLPLLDLACIPFFCARLAGCFVSSYMLRTLFVRLSGHGYILLRCVFYLLFNSLNYLVTLHNEIRDSRYLVGTQLANRS